MRRSLLLADAFVVRPGKQIPRTKTVLRNDKGVPNAKIKRFLGIRASKSSGQAAGNPFMMETA